ncbi:hypothetical protein E6O75_ATG01801 [Venturia nashicola]|uniref:Uncharacterized protein n=1 Tax=Venturia nashicola TaxID=86259 RepID=A0A4Z1NM30_9PEZI|nr:hypothetical protein E6O75_ATG01801 [Venturia nashicola]
MDSYSAAFADLLVDQNDRRIDDRPGIRRPSLAVIENHLSSEAAANPALVGWQTFKPNDDMQADAMEGMCRGQSHRRNMAARGPPAATQFTPTRPPPLSQRPPPLSQRPPPLSQRPPPLSQRPAQPAQPAQPAKLRVTAEEKPRARRTAEQPLYVAKPAPKSTHPSTSLMASKWAPQASGLATNLTGWTAPRAGVKITRMEAQAPTVFRERPKRPPVRSVPETSNATSANIGRPVAASTVAASTSQLPVAASTVAASTVAASTVAASTVAASTVATAKVAPAKAAPAIAAPAKAAPAPVALAKVVVPSPPKSTPIAPSSVPRTVGIIEVRCAGHENGGFYVDRYLAEATIEMLKANAIKTEDIQADQDVWRVN